MDRLTENKIVLVVRDSRWRSLLAKHGTAGHAEFFLGSRQLRSQHYRAEDRCIGEAQALSVTTLSRLGRLQVLNRDYLPQFLFGPQDIVVVLGQDGLVANTLKYTDGQPVIGVNPDPGRYDGVLLPFQVKDLDRIVPEVFALKRQHKLVTMAEARLNDGRTLRAVNDLFLGARTHASARYEIHTSDRAEDQSSSGIIVSTGMGSTGWFRGLLAGAVAMIESFGYGNARIAHQSMPRASARLLMAVKPPDELEAPAAEESYRSSPRTFTLGLKSPPPPPPSPKFDGSFPWDSRFLYFSVREPFPTRTTGTSIVFGQVTPLQPLRVTSQMPENGVIFSDGIENDFLEFNSGDIATIGISERVGKLVV